MSYLNPFQKPIETDTLEAWAKLLEDIAKVAILALPVIFYGQNSLIFKLINITLLFFIVYTFINLGRFLRRYKAKQENGG